MRADAAAVLRARLSDYGLDINGPSRLEELEAGVPKVAMVERRKARREYALLYAPRMTMTEVTRFESEVLGPHPLLVLGPAINERSAEMFRRLDVHYIDQAGNAYLDFDGVHIDVRGRRPEGAARSVKGAEGRGTNLFSTKRSQVIFALLSWPELTSAPVRVLAHAAGVSLGQAQETLALLGDAGYIDDDDVGERRMRRGGDLLDRWAIAFPSTFGAQSRQREFAGDARELRVPDDASLIISGEAAVPQQLRPETLTVYVDEFSGALAAVNRWRTDREPNIFVRTTFWRDPHGDPEPGSITPAPTTLVYADLLASRDSRQLEVAGWLRENDDRLQRL